MTNKDKSKFTMTAADSAFSKCVKARVNYTCERCGTSYLTDDSGLDCSHNFSRAYKAIRYHPYNAMALCFHCHKYWWHSNPIDSGEWAVKKLGKVKIEHLRRLRESKSKDIQLAISPLLTIGDSNLIVVLNGKFKNTHGVFLMSVKRFLFADEAIKFPNYFNEDTSPELKRNYFIQHLFEKSEGRINWWLPNNVKSLSDNLNIEDHFTSLYQYTHVNCGKMQKLMQIFGKRPEGPEYFFNQDLVEQFLGVLKKWGFN